jgi:hypothetical protein
VYRATQYSYSLKPSVRHPTTKRTTYGNSHDSRRRIIHESSTQKNNPAIRTRNNIRSSQLSINLHPTCTPLRTVSGTSTATVIIETTNAALEEVRVNMAEMKAENKPVELVTSVGSCVAIWHTRLDEHVWGVGSYNASRLLHRAT